MPETIPTSIALNLAAEFTRMAMTDTTIAANWSSTVIHPLLPRFGQLSPDLLKFGLGLYKLGVIGCSCSSPCVLAFL